MTFISSPSPLISFQLKSFAPIRSESQSNKSVNSTQSLSGNEGNLENPARSENGSVEKTIAEQRQLQQLKIRDREVRAHELAHVSVGGRFVTSGAQFSFQKGNDGRFYAVSGEVAIDTAEIPDDPEATLLKAQVVIRAALAPANPSTQDRRVAAQASVVAQAARIELALESTESESEISGNLIDAFV